MTYTHHLVSSVTQEFCYMVKGS